MSSEGSSNTGFKIALSAGALAVVVLSSVGALVLFAGIAALLVGMLLAMMPSEPVASVALDPSTESSLSWTEGEHAQELWLEVDLSHHFDPPWLTGDILIDGEAHSVSFSGEAVLLGDSGKMTAEWRSDGDHAQGWTRVLKLPQAGPGTEHEIEAVLVPGQSTTPRILRLHIVDCDNWSCDPDRIF